MNWKKGRGALGIFEPLLGSWIAQPAGDQLASKASCIRSFTRLWDGYVRLDARWSQGPGRAYEEMALFGKNREGALAFWSFTSDGKQSQGAPVDGSDVHPQAIAFAAEMPAGIARFVYWPHETEGFYFAVESKTQKGWNRFLRHHYLPA